MSEDNQHTESAATRADNPFLFDADRLREIASDTIIKRGVAYFRENRVTDLDWDASAVRGLVHGSIPDSPYMVTLSHDHDQELCIECDCPFDWEPVCKHAVAVLLGYASQLADPESDKVSSAADLAVKERSDRARTEVRVSHVSGQPAFGTWNAASLSPSSHFRRNYTVQIRSLSARVNYCSCPDWASNQLGTCKHIEAVLHRLRKSAKGRKDYDRAPPFPFVWLSWDAPDGPAVRVQRSPSLPPDLAEIIDRYFDAAGSFRGELPDDFFRFSDLVQGRDDLLLGEDALLHVRQLAEDAARRVRGDRIHEEILRSGRSLPGVHARLYPYQIEGVAFLASRGRALLADDMGLGKTLQAIAAARWLQQHADVSKVLVICPASLKHQWAREIERFTDSTATVIQGPPDQRARQYRQSGSFLIMNYELVLRDLSYLNENVAPDLLILDEAQRIKNWRTKIASTIKLIATRYAFVLTGTPLENRLEDLYSLMQVVDHRVLGPLWRYLIEFHVSNDRGKLLGYRNLSELRRRLAPVMLRRNRSLVVEQLPERIEQRLDVPMTPKQMDLHDAAMKNAASYAAIAKKRPLTPVEQNRLMAALQQARMACDAAGLVDKETKGAPKLDELAQLLEDLCVQEGLKVVVFSQWERMTAMAEAVARGLKIGCARLHGGVPTAKRGALLDRFREDESIQVFISTDAGGVGLNLQCASAVINLDMPWNPAVLDQRIARVHRLGQAGTVQVILMVAADSYEERVTELIQNKRDLFDNVVDPEATEDVVGVNKKLLDTLVEDLREETKPSPGNKPGPEDEPATTGTAEPAGEKTALSEPDTTAEDAAVRQTISEIQTAFGPRIERILGAGGGLLVVVDHVDAELEERVETLTGNVPVALIDPHTLTGLQRLGATAVIGQTRLWFDAGEQPQTPEVPALLAIARRKLAAGEVLIEQQHISAALELVASAMVAAAACHSGQSQAPTLPEVAVWIYSRALPAGTVSAEQGTAIMRAVSLCNAPEVPADLVREVLADARQIVEQVA